MAHFGQSMTFSNSFEPILLENRGWRWERQNGAYNDSKLKSTAFIAHMVSIYSITPDKADSMTVE